MTGLVRIRRAIVSVSDRRGLVPLALALERAGARILSTGGTARSLGAGGVRVTPIEEVTGFPEMLGGRVKTLHPIVHAGLLSIAGDAAHEAACREHGIEPIDLVCVNLYPFERVASRAGVPEEDAIEQIDIGGPALIRSGAKNHERVAVLTSPDQYERVIDELRAHDGAISRELRRELAIEAFARTSEYDGVIAMSLSRAGEGELPGVVSIVGRRSRRLRYGENPHQRGAAYRTGFGGGGRGVSGARVLGERELGYNNLADAAAAVEVVRGLGQYAPARACACVVKHGTPCGAAVAEERIAAVDGAIEGDPVSAFGGIVALSGEVDGAIARRLAREGAFFEVIAARSFTREAAERLLARWKRVRLLELGDESPEPAERLEARAQGGDLLVQDADTRVASPGAWRHEAGPAPDEARLWAAGCLEMVCRRVLSNAVVIGGVRAGVASVWGIGGGQTDRVSACRLAVEKAGQRARGAIAVSDGFFPFPDGPEVLLEAGVTMLVHPGGSKRDAETFGVCEDHGVACLTTGLRRFRH